MTKFDNLQKFITFYKFYDMTSRKRDIVCKLAFIDKLNVMVSSQVLKKILIFYIFLIN